LRLTIPQLMTFGVLFTLVKLATLLVFGPENRLAMFQVILVPAFLLYPAGFTSAFLLIRREKSLFERARQSAEHRRQFEVAIQSSPSGIMIYRDADHICVYANEMAASLLETTVDALVGSNIEAFITTVAPTRSEDQPVPYALPT